jgi:endonuclease/exonuclease/phosphatase family metal-dependent hydrolase
MSEQDKSSSLSVMSWNMLVPKFGLQCVVDQPEDKAPLERLTKSIDFIATMVEHGVDVICLQEVSREWGAVLKFQLSMHNFDCKIDNYGGEFSDHMGILTAWNAEKFHGICEAHTASEEACMSWESFDAENPKPVLSLCERFKHWLSFTEPNEELDIWEKRVKSFTTARKKKNVYHVLHLSDGDCDLRFNYDETGSMCLDDATVRVTNYHMPCAFFDPEVMMCHIYAITSRMDALYFATKVPTILAGDWNTKTTDTWYKFFHSYNNALTDIAFRGGVEIVTKAAGVPVVSTIHAKSLRKGKVCEFEGAIDHLFYRGNITPKSGGVIHRGPVRLDGTLDVMPNKHWPSDHATVICHFDLLIAIQKNVKIPVHYIKGYSSANVPEVDVCDVPLPIVMLGGNRGKHTLIEKILALKVHGVRNSWYVDGADESLGTIGWGTSVHAKSGPATDTYAAFDHTTNPLSVVLEDWGDYVVLRNTRELVNGFIQCLINNLDDKDEDQLQLLTKKYMWKL